MGTRSMTTFIEKYKDDKGKKRDNKVVTIYKQYDGYPSGFGLDLSTFLSKGKVVNGIGMDDEFVFNGMGCLAAQVVSEFKEGPGGIYLYRGGTKDCGEAYMYEIIIDNETMELTMKCMEVGYMDKNDKLVNKTRTLFSGTPKEMMEFCTEEAIKV